MQNNSPAYVPYIHICIYVRLPTSAFNGKRESLNCATRAAIQLARYIKRSWTSVQSITSVEGAKLLSKTFAKRQVPLIPFSATPYFRDTLGFIEHAVSTNETTFVPTILRTISANEFFFLLVWKDGVCTLWSFIAGPCQLAWSRVCGGSSRWSWSPLIRLISRLSSPSRGWILQSRAPRISLSRRRSSTVLWKAAARRLSLGWVYNA